MEAMAETMEYFKQFSSNSLAGSGNQLFFCMKDGEVQTGRVFYRITAPGEFNYSLLFSNVMDSTYSDGKLSHSNLICREWMIHAARIGICKEIPTNINWSKMAESDCDDENYADIQVSDFQIATFDGKTEKNVMPGEFFASDPIKLSFDADTYLCLELTFSGSMIPYHEESLLPMVLQTEDGRWKYSRKMPVAGMIGCDRWVKGRIAYLGDSITQGIGTDINTYSHWNAVLSRKLNQAYSFWNLGIGFARTGDGASDGAWLYKAKKNDVVFVCLGVNDILQGVCAEQIEQNLETIVAVLKNAGKRVVLQTIPPFNYSAEDIDKWKRVNTYIQTVLKEKADIIFDNVPLLRENEGNSHIAAFGGHPNAQGCAVWGEVLYEAIRAWL